MNEHSTAVAAAMIGALVGGIAASVDHALSFIAVGTGVVTGTARYYAILRGSDKAQTERATAYGFFIGAAASAFLLVLDRVLGG